MKALVIYDSFFGNTEIIARAIGAGLGTAEEVSVVRVSDAKAELISGVELLVVGSPTRQFTASPGTVAFLKSLPAGSLKDKRVAVFDTRLDVKKVNNAVLTFLEKIFGYAADQMAKLVVKKGGEPGVTKEWFFIEASEGPLTEGELEHAATWAKKLS